MKKIQLLMILALVFLLVGSLCAEITFSGDARVRPRLDQQFSNGDMTSGNIYYLYWARLWVDAKLTDGYYFRTKLSADGPADFIGTFGGGTYDGLGSWSGAKSAIGGTRGILRFSEMHFGRKTENWGYSMGILPFSGLANPEYDIHFFPLSKSDIPFTILNRNSSSGFRGYYKVGPGLLNASLTVDNNLGSSDGNDNTDDARDQYSLFLNYTMKLGNFKVQPTIIKTIASPDTGTVVAPLAAPMTAGANFGLPKIAGFALSAGGYFTMQGVEDAGKYTGPGIHAKVVGKLGPGSLVAWADWKSITMDGEDDACNTTLLWIMYKYTVYKSDVGSFALAPTFRRIMQVQGDAIDYARNKIELTMHFSFK